MCDEAEIQHYGTNGRHDEKTNVKRTIQVRKTAICEVEEITKIDTDCENY